MLIYLDKKIFHVCYARLGALELFNAIAPEKHNYTSINVAVAHRTQCEHTRNRSTSLCVRKHYVMTTATFQLPLPTCTYISATQYGYFDCNKLFVSRKFFIRLQFQHQWLVKVRKRR